MALILALFLNWQTPQIQEWDQLARNRDVAKLDQNLLKQGPSEQSPFRFLKTNGAYGSGSMGWRVLGLRDIDGKTEYALFTTNLTSEDIGEQLFVIDKGKIGALISEADPGGFRVNQNALVVRFDIPSKTADILCKTTFERVGDRKESFIVRIGPNYRVTDIKDSSGETIRFNQSGGVLSLKAPAVKRFTYVFRYKGVVDLPHFAGAITPGEASLTNDYWWPMIARGAAPYTLTVRGPRGWEAVGQGTQTELKENDEERITSFRMDLPVSYYSLSLGPYRTETTNVGKWKFWSTSKRASIEAMRRQNVISAPVIEFFHGNLSPYPFHAWGTLDSVIYGGGALEAYSYATYGGGMPGEDAHEPAHTWWGGVIPNTYLRSLWNESFAVYSDGFYQRNAPIGNTQERGLAFIQDAEPIPTYNEAPCADAGAGIGPAAVSLGYGKGAAVLQMLEVQIGKDKMLAAMQHWLRSHKPGKTGEWENFESAAIEIVGASLRPFFQQWLRRKGWADFEVTSVDWSDGKLFGKIRWNSEPYRIQCEALVKEASGREVVVQFDTMQMRDGLGYKFEIPYPNRPTLVSIDPWRRILRTYRADETPTQLSTLLDRTQLWVEKGRETSARAMFGNRQQRTGALPEDLSGWILFGHPAATPQIKTLFERSGLNIEGDVLTWKGTSIDLETQGAMAVVDLQGGKQCILAIGNSQLQPRFGRARTVLFDHLGRFLRGFTEPKRSGWMVFRL